MDLSEWILLLGKGLFVALVALSLVWARRAPDPVRRLAWVTVFLTFDLVVFGGFTRLTDSGLGCPDWPGCFAKSNPFAAREAIDAAVRSAPGGAVTMAKAWIEMIHRFLAIAVGVLIAILALAAWLQRAKLQRLRALPFAIFALVCLQGAFGAWTVTQKLQPVIVTTHLLLGLTLLGLLGLNALRLDPGRSAPRVSPGSSAGLRVLALASLVILAIQIALGGWVSTNYAVLACPDFPLCHGQWVPAMDLGSGFELWRQLGRTEANGYITSDALTAIHWVHRSFAVIVALVLAALGGAVWQVLRERRLALVLYGLLALQIATGMGNVVLRWPLAIAVLHNAGAAGLVLTLVVINYWTAQTKPGPRFPVRAQFAAT